MKSLLIHTMAFNQKDLLDQMINSIDTKLDYDMLIHIHSKNSEILKYLEQFKNDKKFNIINIGFNRGVAEAWNDALEYGYESNNYQHILLINSDIKLGSGDLDRMIAFSNAKPDKLIAINGTRGRIGDWEPENLSHGMACMIIPKIAFDQIGYFDENFFPAYLEDCDYYIRLWLSRNLGPIKPGFNTGCDPDSPLTECVLSGKTHHEGSSVIYSSKDLFSRNQRTHGANFKYYIAKWGGLNYHETYDCPFGEDGKEVGLGLKIDVEHRHNPFSDFWDRAKEKEKYYNETSNLL